MGIAQRSSAVLAERSSGFVANVSADSDSPVHRCVEGNEGILLKAGEVARVIEIDFIVKKVHKVSTVHVM